MNSTIEIKTIERKIGYLTELSYLPAQNYEAITKEIWALEKKKISLSILSEDGLVFNPINQFNSVHYGVFKSKTSDYETVDLQCNFDTFLVNKYHNKFGDCEWCNRAKNTMEVQIFMPNYQQVICFDCFEKEMKHDYLVDNFDFEITELDEDLSDCKYQFSYNGVCISFDTFTYYKNKNEHNSYYIEFYQTHDLYESRKISSLMNLKLSQQELNFLTSQYKLKSLEEQKVNNQTF